MKRTLVSVFILTSLIVLFGVIVVNDSVYSLSNQDDKERLIRMELQKIVAFGEDEVNVEKHNKYDYIEKYKQLADLDGVLFPRNVYGKPPVISDAVVVQVDKKNPKTRVYHHSYREFDKEISLTISLNQVLMKEERDKKEIKLEKGVIAYIKKYKGYKTIDFNHKGCYYKYKLFGPNVSDEEAAEIINSSLIAIDQKE